MSGHRRQRSGIEYELVTRRGWIGDGATNQTHEVQPSVTLLSPLASIENGLVLMERPLLDRNINTNDVLPDDTSSTDVQVSVESRPG